MNGAYGSLYSSFDCVAPLELILRLIDLCYNPVVPTGLSIENCCRGHCLLVQNKRKMLIDIRIIRIPLGILYR